MADTDTMTREQRRWWTKGAEAEADARDEGLTPKQREVRSVFEDMCRFRNENAYEEHVVDTLGRVLNIYVAGLPWRRRWRIAREVLR